ncbi:MAG: citrate synthase, partial [Lachnospiraceae bacterium]|nr:citrate synthase [Lachnospiraceae bacterium]
MAVRDLITYANEKTPLCVKNDTISDTLFEEFGVNRGLRDINGKGVLTGLTNISKVCSFKEENGQKVPCDGEL